MPQSNVTRSPLHSPVTTEVLQSVARTTWITFVGSATSTTDTLVIPVAARTDDLMVLFDLVETPVATVIPAGWTAVGPVSGATLRRQTSFRFFRPGDSLVTGMVGTTNSSKIMMVFRANFGCWAGKEGSRNSQVTAGIPVDQTVTVPAGPLVVLAAYGATPGVTVRGFTPAHDAEVTVGSTRNAVRYKIYNDTATNTLVTMGDDGTNNLSSFYWAAQ